jgi:multidrug efflux pump subunit AcrA (membrane-fusion protein)
MKRLLRLAATVLVLGLLAGGALFGYRHWRKAEATASLPTAPARKGEFLVLVRSRGELKATRSAAIMAPTNIPDLRIAFAAPNGAEVQQGEVVVRFDSSGAQRQLQQYQATVSQTQASLDQAVAQARLALTQSKLDVSAARNQVERARLEASKAEIVSAIQAEESKLDLAMAEQKLVVQEQGAELDKLSNEAKIRSLTRTRDKAAADIKLTKERLQNMEVTAPITGALNYLPNYSQSMISSAAQPFKVGDSVYAGATIAEIPDLNSLIMGGKVEETDRGRVAVNQEVLMRLDSLPEVTFPARLTFLSPLTVLITSEYPPTRGFGATVKPDQADSRLRPLMNGSMDIIISRLPNAISIPLKALFTRKGKPIVYVPSKKGYQPVEVEVLARNPDEVAIRGIAEGTRVTLVEPGQEGATGAGAAPAKPGGAPPGGTPPPPTPGGGGAAPPPSTPAPTAAPPSPPARGPAQ